jgi:hypothetical protein
LHLIALPNSLRIVEQFDELGRKISVVFKPPPPSETKLRMKVLADLAELLVAIYRHPHLAKSK